MPKRLAILVAVLAVAGCAESEVPSPQAANPDPPVARKFTRDEFREAIKGKHTDEVRALLGPPADTWERARNTSFIYRSITVDSATGATDAEVAVLFKDKYAIAAEYPGGPTDCWSDLR